MSAIRVVVHAAASLAPVLAFDGLFQCILGESREYMIYGCGVVFFGLAVAVVASWFPVAVLVALRNGGLAPGERPRIRRPLHPLGWITGLGVTAYVGAMFLGPASSLSPSRFQFMAGLGALAVLLSWRYVAALPRPDRTRFP